MLWDALFRLGERSAAIVQLKQMLNTLPYITPKLKTTPEFDKAMEAAIKEFQLRNGLDGGGVLDKNTVAMVGKVMPLALLAAMTVTSPAFAKFYYMSRLNQLVATWKEVAPVIPEDDFVGWGYKGIKENCFDYATEQLRKAGYQLKAPGWRSKKGGLQNGVYQLYMVETVYGMAVGYRMEDFIHAVSYLKTALAAGVPVMAGVDCHSGSPNSDKTTDHFVVMVGMGSDSEGKYFRYYDNASGNQKNGTSPDNKIYCYIDGPKLQGKGAASYVADSEYGHYFVSQVRESKPK